MNAKTWVPLIVAVVLGTIAAVVARKSMPTRAILAGPKMASVVVAKGAIPPGATLTADALTTASLGSLMAPPDSFTRPGDLIGRVTAAPVLPGQALLGSLLAPTGAPSGLAALVPPGLRAVTIDVSESSGLAGLAVPGCRVDVVSTEISQDPGKTCSRLIVQNVPVVAVGQRLSAARPEDKEPQLARTVTLLVTPRQAEALDVGMAAARVRLILRGTSDKEQVADEGVALADLTGEKNATAGQPIAPVLVPETVVITTPPTTQPNLFSKSVEETPTRQLTVIAGNDERHVTFKEPRAAHSEVTDTRDNVIAN